MSNYIKQIENLQWENSTINFESKSEIHFPPQKDLANSSIIIDNGSYEIKGGFSFQDEPCISFRSLVAKPKLFGSLSNDLFVVGNKIYDYEQGKIHKKSPFEKNILTHFGTFEHILDNIFYYLQIRDESVNHPVLITETFANLNFSRKSVTEMLFELYGVPSICYGVDFLFSLYHNNNQFRNYNSNFNSLIVSSSFQYTHIVPIINGIVDLNKSRRLNIGSEQSRDLLMKSLHLKFPELKTKLTNEVIQNIQEKYTTTALNYESQLKLLEEIFQEEQKELRDLELVNIYGSLDMYEKVCRNLGGETILKEGASKFSNLKTYKNFSDYNNQNFTDLNENIVKKLYFFKRPQFLNLHVPTDEEIRQKQEMKKEQSKRLKEMMQKKREENLKNLQLELENLEHILQVKDVDKFQFEELLTNNGFNSYEELQKRYTKILNKLNINSKDKEIDLNKRWPLLSVPDEDLTVEQMKMKRIQKMQKNAYLSRLEKREQSQKEKEKIEELKHKNPEEYLVSLFKSKKEILERLEKFQQIRKDLTNRHSKSNMKRMQTLAELGKDSTDSPSDVSSDDEFGKKDEDWDLYREISKHNLSDEEEEEQQHLHEIETKIIEIDPDFLKKTEIYQYNYFNKNNTFLLGVDQFKGPELLFKPYLIGIEQAGVTELIVQLIKSLSTNKEKENLINNIFLTGGNMKIPNIKERLGLELREFIPVEMDVNVSLAEDPILDAWKGGKDFVNDENNQKFFISRQEYQEQGAHFFKEHCASNRKVYSLGDKREINEVYPGRNMSESNTGIKKFKI